MKLSANKKPTSYIDKSFQRAHNSDSSDDNALAVGLAVQFCAELEDVLRGSPEGTFMLNVFHGSMQLSFRADKRSAWESTQAQGGMLELLVALLRG